MLSKSEEKLLMKFMETTIKMVNSCMARIWMLEKLLIEKGIAVPQDLKNRIKEAEKHPDQIGNKKLLLEMVKEFNAKMDSSKG